MCTSIIGRDIDPGDKAWLRRESRQVCLSIEELACRLIHGQRMKAELRPGGRPRRSPDTSV